MTGSYKRTFINNLFSGSGCFYDVAKNTYQALIVDEAHRLNLKSGLYGNNGENQIKEFAHRELIFVQVTEMNSWHGMIS